MRDYYYNTWLIEAINKVTGISTSKLEKYLQENGLKNFFEHPESIGATNKQIEKINDLIKLNNLYNKLSKYKEYKFEETLDAVDFLKNSYEKKSDKERFIVMFLDDERKLLGLETISVGTLNASIVHPRDVMKQAIKYNSNNIIISHNHPSGDPTPSNEDINITNRLNKVARDLNINILDHVIVAGDSYHSFKENMDINNENIIKKTNNKVHEKIYKEDQNKFIDLLSKFLKITKKELNDLVKENKIEDLINKPNNYFDIEKSNKISMLEEIKYMYYGAMNNKYKISGPEEVGKFIRNHCNNIKENDMAIFLDTKNKIINVKGISEKLNEEEKYEYIMKNAIMYDSNSFILSSRKDQKELNYQEINSEREKIKTIKEKTDLLGIYLLDNIYVDNYGYYSYKDQGYIKENVETYNVNKRTIDKIKVNDFKEIVKVLNNERVNTRVNKRSVKKEKELLEK